ncbi:MAG: hypothetical protein ACI94D_002215 [Neolewinella sp.]|jgi:hypothetical protein
MYATTRFGNTPLQFQAEPFPSVTMQRWRRY